MLSGLRVRVGERDGSRKRGEEGINGNLGVDGEDDVEGEEEDECLLKAWFC